MAIVDTVSTSTGDEPLAPEPVGHLAPRDFLPDGQRVHRLVFPGHIKDDLESQAVARIVKILPRQGFRHKEERVPVEETGTPVPHAPHRGYGVESFRRGFLTPYSASTRTLMPPPRSGRAEPKGRSGRTWRIVSVIRDIFLVHRDFQLGRNCLRNHRGGHAAKKLSRLSGARLKQDLLSLQGSFCLLRGLFSPVRFEDKTLPAGFPFFLAPLCRFLGQPPGKQEVPCIAVGHVEHFSRFFPIFGTSSFRITFTAFTSKGGYAGPTRYRQAQR
ncbi:MAG: hypothetical protein MZU95_07590 [Desulfomicrobium escambiense]|nr:hypothetical protein [Desulfomicrobium escambiense]